MNYYLSEDDKKNLELLRNLLWDILFIFVECDKLFCVCNFFNLYKEMFKIEN